MLNEAQRIADQLNRAFQGMAWHGPSLKESLEGVTVAQAIARPIAAAHSIWEIVAHIGAWEGVVARRLNGESVAEPAVDFPQAPANASEDDWHSLQTATYQAHTALVVQIAAMTEDELRRRIDDKPYPAWFMVHGAVSHALYHVGQIVLLTRQGA